MPNPTRDANEVIPFPSGIAQPTERPQPTGYANVRLNALKHGVLSRHTVLAHEDATEFEDLLRALVDEHKPIGPTETHLVEELAGAIWRKRRVLQAEGATINRGLLAVTKARHDRAFDPDGPARAAAPFEPKMAQAWVNVPCELADVMQRTREQTQIDMAKAEDDLAAAQRAVKILRRGGARAYQRALRALSVGGFQCWDDHLDGVDDSEAAATPESLLHHLVDDLLPFFRQAAVEARHHEAIKAQTLGEGLQADHLEKLSRYETHLDRKFERTLAMLLKLKEMRRGV